MRVHVHTESLPKMSVMILIRPNKKNKCVSGKGSENFRPTYFLKKVLDFFFMHLHVGLTD